MIEEILMRGYLLQGLSVRYGHLIALLVSSLLFALLHFNMVQMLSAFVCGIALGLLYLRTGSLFCCILTHAGYNLISYVTMILPMSNAT
ncbi:MAG: CPBP family intramembrane metalloprotease [Christensenellaceae bacterium]|nr:CPBP family intramembrane metalloprotease [Christensenellaceae bacterium]